MTGSTQVKSEKEQFSHDFFQKTLDALQAHIAILDEQGTIIAVNSTWKAFATSNDLATEFCGPGANYLRACDNARGDCSEEAHVVSEGIRAVIAGARPVFYMEYPCHSLHEQRWFSVRITSFEIDGQTRAVVTHDNITMRKIAEIQMLSINRGLQNETRIDAMTRIGNRRLFDLEYENQWQAHTQGGRPLSLALIDIDFFKQFNDSLGHPKGDECLKAVAACIRSAVLPEEKVTRYGGEEFAVLFPDTKAAEAWHKVEAIRKAILALQILHPRSAVSAVVSASIGCASCIPHEDSSPAEFLHCADSAMYRAKSQGRNKSFVACCDPPVAPHETNLEIRA